MNIATNISVTNTPIPIPITMPCKKASPSGSVVGRNFIQLYPYPSLHTEYIPESRDCQVFFLTFFVSIYRGLQWAADQLVCGMSKKALILGSIRDIQIFLRGSSRIRRFVADFNAH